MCFIIKYQFLFFAALIFIRQLSRELKSTPQKFFFSAKGRGVLGKRGINKQKIHFSN